LDAFCKTLSAAEAKKLKDGLKSLDWKAIEEADKEESEVVIRT